MQIYQQFRPFGILSFQEWPCPKCGKALDEDTERRQIIESPRSIQEHENENWEPDWRTGRFSAHLLCNNPKCGELVSVFGKWSPTILENYDPEDHYYCEMVDQLFPEAVFPPIPLIRMPKKVPERVKLHLDRSFALFWLDSASCLNSLRAALEASLTEFGIPKKFKRMSGRVTEAKLHERIERLEKLEPEISELMMAIKWLGNQGSHDNETPETLSEKVETAFTILSVAIHKLYDPLEKDAHNLAKVTIKSKGKKP